MKSKSLLLFFLILTCLVIGSGCASTRTENGVTIENRSSFTPFKMIPFL